MGFLDNISKSISQGIDRAKFEADKLARVTRVQSELGDLRRNYDAKRLELADRALELYRAGQIQSASIAGLARDLDGVRSTITLKEDELQAAQNENYIEPMPSSPPTAQNVPVSVDPNQTYTPPTQTYTPPTQTYTPPSQSTPATGVPSDKKLCPSCSFVMPKSAMFCPNCGTRVGV